jgi:hypothetical protein
VPMSESTAMKANWIDLEDGVQIAFAAGGSYRSGDYWVIPARAATGGIEWPRSDSQPAFQPSQGIVHHLAPLGVLLSNDGFRITPCRTCIGPASVDCVLPTAPASTWRPEKMVVSPRPTPAKSTKTKLTASRKPRAKR